MYRTEVKLYTGILGEPAKISGPCQKLGEHHPPNLNLYLPANDETPSAIENGANALAEGFLFTVAAALILGEPWRSSRSQSRRRGDVDD